MAAVLICEPHGDISSLLALVVSRLGHEPVVYHGEEIDPSKLDAAVIEPGEPGGMRLAIRLRSAGVPVVFTSIFPPHDSAVSLRPAAYLVKPFPLYRLQETLASILGPPRAATATAC